MLAQNLTRRRFDREASARFDFRLFFRSPSRFKRYFAKGLNLKPSLQASEPPLKNPEEIYRDALKRLDFQTLQRFFAKNPQFLDRFPEARSYLDLAAADADAKRRAALLLEAETATAQAAKSVACRCFLLAAYCLLSLCLSLQNGASSSGFFAYSVLVIYLILGISAFETPKLVARIGLGVALTLLVVSFFANLRYESLPLPSVPSIVSCVIMGFGLSNASKSER